MSMSKYGQSNGDVLFIGHLLKVYVMLDLCDYFL